MDTPPPGLAKINVDGAMAKTSDLSVATAVARDEAGNFLGASVLVLEGITSPEVVKTIASDCYCTSLGWLATVSMQ